MRRSEVEWREAAAGCRAALNSTKCDALHAGRQPRAAAQRPKQLRAAPHVTLCAPRDSGELRKAQVKPSARGSKRAARGVQGGAEQLEAAKFARFEVSGARRPKIAEQLEAAQSAQLEVSGARRPRGRRAAPGYKGRAARSERRAASKWVASSSRLQRARGSKCAAWASRGRRAI